nr:transposase [Vibrio anguillarum]
VTVAYDLYTTNSIYLRPSDSYADFIPANLTERSRAFANMTMWELWNTRDEQNTAAATSRLKARAGSVNLVNDLELISDEAKSKQPKYTKAEKVQRAKGISGNKSNERQYERDKKSAKNDQESGESLATVTPI